MERRDCWVVEPMYEILLARSDTPLNSHNDIEEAQRTRYWYVWKIEHGESQSKGEGCYYHLATWMEKTVMPDAAGKWNVKKYKFDDYIGHDGKEYYTIQRVKSYASYFRGFHTMEEFGDWLKDVNQEDQFYTELMIASV